jgi:hypothetical protein
VSKAFSTEAAMDREDFRVLARADRRRSFATRNSLTFRETGRGTTLCYM